MNLMKNGLGCSFSMAAAVITAAVAAAVFTTTIIGSKSTSRHCVELEILPGDFVRQESCKVGEELNVT